MTVAFTGQQVEFLPVEEDGADQAGATPPQQTMAIEFGETVQQALAELFGALEVVEEPAARGQSEEKPKEAVVVAAPMFWVNQPEVLPLEMHLALPAAEAESAVPVAAAAPARDTIVEPAVEKPQTAPRMENNPQAAFAEIDAAFSARVTPNERTVETVPADSFERTTAVIAEPKPIKNPVEPNRRPEPLVTREPSVTPGPSVIKAAPKEFEAPRNETADASSEGTGERGSKQPGERLEAAKVKETAFKPAFRDPQKEETERTTTSRPAAETGVDRRLASSPAASAPAEPRAAARPVIAQAAPAPDLRSIPAPEVARAASNEPIARDFSLRLPNPNADAGNVDLRLQDHAGELRVSVRTPDPALTRDLREGLSNLVGRLEQTGFRTELWVPAAEGSSLGEQHQRRGTESEVFSNSRDGRSQDGFAGREQGGGRERHPQPKWVDELEASFGSSRVSRKGKSR